MPSLSLVLGPQQAFDLDTGEPETMLRALAGVVARDAKLEEGKVLQAIAEREALCSTGFGGGVAMPHVRLAGARRFHVALGRTRTGIPFAAVDGKPVHLLLLIVGPESDKDGYRQLMAKAARFLKAETGRLLASDDLGASLALVAQEY